MTQTLERVDERTELDQRVAHVLSRNSHLGRRRLRAASDNGRVRLEGTVASYFQKQIAQEAVRRVEGVEEVDNQLEVVWS